MSTRRLRSDTFNKRTYLLTKWFDQRASKKQSPQNTSVPKFIFRTQEKGSKTQATWSKVLLTCESLHASKHPPSSGSHTELHCLHSKRAENNHTSSVLGHKKQNKNTHSRHSSLNAQSHTNRLLRRCMVPNVTYAKLAGRLKRSNTTTTCKQDNYSKLSSNNIQHCIRLRITCNTDPQH